MKITISQYLLHRLNELNVNHLFGIPRDYVLPFFDVLIDTTKKTGITHIGSKNELNAAYSADGYAKINGFGAAAVTYGVGALSTTNGVANSFSDNTPTLLIGGAPTRKARITNGEKLLHHLIGTNFDSCINVLKEVTISSIRLSSVDDASREIDNLLLTAFRNKKPVYLEIPYDLQQAMVDKPKHKLDLSLSLSVQDNLDAAVKQIVALISEAKTVACLVGPHIDRDNLIDSADELILKMNAAVSTLFTQKIPHFEDHPNSVGFYQGSSCEDYTRETMEGSDLLLGLGTTYNEFDNGMFTTHFGENGQKTVFMHHDYVKINGDLLSDVYLVDLLPALLKALHGLEKKQFSVDTTKRRFAFELADKFAPTDDKLTIDRMFIQFANYMQPGDTCVGDTGGYINGAQAQFRQGIDVYGCGNWGSLGSGFGMSVGASFAKSEQPTGDVVCVTGDGAFFMSAQELSTLIEHNQNYTIIILDNAGYGAERQIWPGKERSYNNFNSWNYELLPEAFGGKLNENCFGFVARTEKEFDAVLQEARVRKGVKVIRAIIDRWDTASFNVKMSEAMRH